MQERQQLEALFLAQLESIDRIIDALCRRHGVRGADAEDFGSWVKLRLVESDYAVFRKFRGESSIGTYLTVVLSMLWRDYRVQRWGRWRPSAAARQRGPLAVRLEALIIRDGQRFDHAAQLLRTSGETSLPDRELAGLLAALPTRAPLRPIDAGAEPLERVPETTGADDELVRDELEQSRRAASAALDGALAELPAEDQVILRLRYWEGLSIADVARALGIPQKPLYRHVEQLLETLRTQLEASKISWNDVERFLGAPLPDMDGEENPKSRPSSSGVAERGWRLPR